MKSNNRTRFSASTAHRVIRPDRWHLALLWLRLNLRCGQQLRLLFDSEFGAPRTPKVVPIREAQQRKTAQMEDHPAIFGDAA